MLLRLARSGVGRLVLVLTLTAFSGVCYVAIKRGLVFAPPILFAGLRVEVAGLFLLGLAALLGRPLLPRRLTWAWVIALAATSTTIGYGAMFLSPSQIGAGIASVLGNMRPLFVVVLAAVVLGEPISRGKAAALGLGLVGVTTIAAPALDLGAPVGLAGAALAVLASLSFASAAVIVRRARLGADILPVATWSLIVGGLPLLAASALVERVEVVWSTEFVGLLLFLAVGGTAFANLVWYWLIQGDDVGRLSMFFFLDPVYGLAAAALLLDERISPVQIVGAALTVAGVAAVAWQSGRTGTNADAGTADPATGGSPRHRAAEVAPA